MSKTEESEIKSRKRKIGVITSKYFSLHKGSHTHPERPNRIFTVIKALKNLKSNNYFILSPCPISIDMASVVHSREYVETVKNLPILDYYLDSSNQSLFYETNDMYWNKYTSSCAFLAAGSVNKAVELVLKGEYSASFAIVRPPGHHAGIKRAEGFSWLNNVSIAAQNALKTHNELVKKVLIFDWDVHHGNGTQNIFYARKDVLYISLHRFSLGFYPGTGRTKEVGKGEGEGLTINVPWRQRYLGDSEYMAAFEAIVKPIIREFSPDLVLVSAGFDAAEGDRLGQMEVSPACFGWMAAEIFSLVGKKNCVFALEGGYCLKALSQSVLACIDSIEKTSNRVYLVKREGIGENEGDTTDAAQLMNYCLNCKMGALETLREVCLVQKKYWRCLEKIIPVIENILNSRDQQRKQSMKLILEESINNDSLEEEGFDISPVMWGAVPIKLF